MLRGLSRAALERPLTALADAALLALLQTLRGANYFFITPTPLTHARVIVRAEKRRARDLRDVFGWNLPFAREDIDSTILTLLERADALSKRGDWLASRVRVSSCGARLFLHSSFPTIERDAVFFGPDSYRFAAFLRRELAQGPAPVRVADLGAGSGVGAIVVADLFTGADIVMTDLNAAAVRLARINAAAAGRTVTVLECSTLDAVEGGFDLIIANPPYIADDAGRTYRDGGAAHGSGVSLAWTRSALPRLKPGGRFLLYTGSAIVDGADALCVALAGIARENECALRTEELDPDVWGEELERDAYADAERIAVIGAVMQKM